MNKGYIVHNKKTGRKTLHDNLYQAEKHKANSLSLKMRNGRQAKKDQFEIIEINYETR